MRICILTLLLGGAMLLAACDVKAQSYGRVVINEYMPWPSATCGTTSEFVELLNFGPGPTNIGCYILTTGKYSVTIPPNTILQPGQFFVIAGQSSLPINCGNIDSTVRVHLNWTTCGCTNIAIPTTGDGFMIDGGTANVNLVLFDPALNVVDAVTRQTPVPTVTAITTSSVSNGCTRKTFTLSSMNILYEELGMSTGKANSFARKLDGDCEWIKQPQISANATNNKTSGTTSSITYQFNIVNSMDLCTNVHGSINVSASGSNLASLFPLNYTLAYDVDGNNTYNFGDIYTYGSDATAPDTTINGLVGGSYIVTVGSSKGCNLKSFPFSILPCQSLLPIKLLDFTRSGIDLSNYHFAWRFAELDDLRSMTLESSEDGQRYRAERSFAAGPGSPLQYNASVPKTAARYYRLRLTGANGRTEFSKVIFTGTELTVTELYPNPATDRVNLRMQSPGSGTVNYSLLRVDGRVERSGSFQLRDGENNWQLPLQNLAPGLYQLMLDNGSSVYRGKFVRQ